MISSIHYLPSQLKLHRAHSLTLGSCFSFPKEKLHFGTSQRMRRYLPLPKNGVAAGQRRINASCGVRTNSDYSKSELTLKEEFACVNLQPNIFKTKSVAACTVILLINTQSIFKIPKSTLCTLTAIKTVSNSMAINFPLTHSIFLQMMPYLQQAALIKI